MEIAMYGPVDSSAGQVRLLVIEPAASHDDAIVCQLQPALLDDKPDFEALSYVWGAKGSGGSILINNTAHGVFENLEAALRRLRNAHQCRTLWIDAICINQDDIQERQEQVLLMARVYQQARQVCVWLGEATLGSSCGMKTLAGSHARATVASGKIQGYPDFADGYNIPWKDMMKSSGRMQYGYDSVILEPALGEACELLNRPWWTRAWIMQECVLASRILIMCGSDTVNWSRTEKSLKNSFDAWGMRGIKKLYGVVMNQGNHTVPIAAAYEEIIRLRHARRQATWASTNILEVLYSFRHLNATDPRDKIYAFLGLAPSATDFLPDYKSPVSHVYVNFAKTLINCTGSLDILNCVREWKSVRLPAGQSMAYSLIDQARYYDVYGWVKDTPDANVRVGWVRLPLGWERVWTTDFQSARYVNHCTGETQDSSPVAGQVYAAEPLSWHKVCTAGLTKIWDNLGRSQFIFPTEAPKDSSNTSDAPGGQFHELPSWVPAWFTSTYIDPFPLLGWSSQASERPNYCASGYDSASVSASEQHQLGLQGLFFDSIVDLGDAWHPRSNDFPIARRHIDALVSWEAVACNMADTPFCPYVGNSGGRNEVLWRTYVADHVGAQSAPEEWSRLMRCWYDEIGWSTDAKFLFQTFDEANFVDSIAATAQTTKTNNTAASDPPDAAHSAQQETHSRSRRPSRATLSARRGKIKLANHAYYRQLSSQEKGRPVFLSGNWAARKQFTKRYGELISRIYYACAHRRLCRTQKGYIGLVPWNASVGDEVWILAGGKTPFVLRKTAKEGEHDTVSARSLVGEAYVHGIMGGEAWERKDSLDLTSLHLV